MNARVFLNADDVGEVDVEELSRDLRANKFVKGEMQFTDITNRDYFLKAFGDKIRFCVKYNKFLIWNGTCWEVDNDGYVEEELLDEMFQRFCLGK